LGHSREKKLEVCRRASRIVEDVLRKHGLYSEVFQAFAVVGDDKWVGVKHGLRREGFIVTVRIVRSIDAVTADYARIPYDVLEEISSEIRSSIDEVTMVTYAITPKPPSTIEPC
jgi:GMP synthase (glutamine-hydrolysing)